MSGCEVVLLMGPPGAGKGTQAARLAKERALKKLSTGDILRANVAAGTELGCRASSIMAVGELVPDDLIVAMVRNELESMESLRVLLDGFPRTPGQADALDAILAERGISLGAVLLLEVGDEELVRRLLLRAREQGRSDDTEEVIRERMRVYRRDTEPLIEYYRGGGKFHRVDGNGDIDEIYRCIEGILS